MILLGIDAGGTRTRVAVWRDGTRLGTESGPGTALRPGRALPVATGMATVAKALLARLGLTRADRLVVGAAGAGRSADAAELRAALRGEYLAERVLVTTDLALALAALEPPEGIVLLAGTGSVAVARTADGGTRRQGGLGWQMGDEGGGYWIGREALRAAGRAHDHRGPASDLGARLEAHTRSTDLRDLAGWCANAGPREIAGLAGLVVESAAAGDAVARAILDRAAGELADLVTPLAERLEARPVPLGLGGGLLSEGSAVSTALLRELDRRGLAVAALPIEPLAGAPRLAEVG